MQFFTLKQRLSFSIHVQIGVKLLKRLRLKFSHLNQLKFRHNFKDCVRPMCNCGTEIEKKKKKHTFFLRCQFLASERHILHDDLCLIDPPVISFDEGSLLNALLYGSDEFNDKIHREILLRIKPNLVLICAALPPKEVRNTCWVIFCCTFYYL